MIDKEKQKLDPKKQWAKFALVGGLYLLFLLWVKSWLGLIVLPFIFDNYITKKIRWTWWKESEGPVRVVMSWVDALVFALVAVYFINLSCSKTTSSPLPRWRRVSSRATISPCRR